MTKAVHALVAALALGVGSSAAHRSVHTVFGTGVAGYSDRETTTPFGFAMGPDDALYFCEMDGQRVRRLDLATKRVTTIAGSGERGYSGDGGRRPRGGVQATRPWPREYCILISE